MPCAHAKAAVTVISIHRVRLWTILRRKCRLRGTQELAYTRCLYLSSRVKFAKTMILNALICSLLITKGVRFNAVCLGMERTVFYITESISVGVTSILVQNTRTLADEKTQMFVFGHINFLAQYKILI